MSFTVWKGVTGDWCISDPYGTTVSIGGKEEVEVLIDELKKILEKEK